MSSLNFCFWQLDNTAYCVTYNNTKYSGYWALCAAIALGKQLGVDLTDASYVNSPEFTLAQLKQCFPPHASREVPLLERRFQILKQNAAVLVERYEGDVCVFVR